MIWQQYGNAIFAHAVLAESHRTRRSTEWRGVARACTSHARLLVVTFTHTHGFIREFTFYSIWEMTRPNAMPSHTHTQKLERKLKQTKNSMAADLSALAKWRGAIGTGGGDRSSFVDFVYFARVSQVIFYAHGCDVLFLLHLGDNAPITHTHTQKLERKLKQTKNSMAADLSALAKWPPTGFVVQRN